jgi:quercetin dioxygenase-like cupin family protein
MSISLEEMESTRVARFKNLKPFKVAYLDAVLPEYQRENLKVIGRGVAERADQIAPIAGDHEFSMTLVKMEPGGGVAPHAHPTSEVFMPLNAPCTVLWGDSEDDIKQIDLQPWDTMSVPIGEMRWFKNNGTEPVYLLALTGGAQSSVTWREDVVKRVEELGLVRVGNQIMAKDNFKNVDGLKRDDIPTTE